MVSLEQCREILEKGGHQYSDEQIVKVRDFLYKMASIDYRLFKLTSHHEKNCHPLHPRLHR